MRMGGAKQALKGADFSKSIEYINEVKRIVNSEFNKIKEDLLREFNNHPVTKEIESGVDSLNSSGTLGGVGNLFTFIGFERNDRPIDVIRSAFNAIRLTSTMVKRNGDSQTYIMYPSASDIFKITPLPWAEGRSWAKGIESGLPGLGKFLHTESDVSRSGEGIQTSKNIRSAKFSNTKYISSIINQFEIDIKKINLKKI